MTSLRYRKISYSSCYGLTHLEAHFHASHTIFLSLWVKAMVPIEQMLPSTCLQLASKITDSQDRICDIKSLEEMRHKAKKNSYFTINRSAKHTTISMTTYLSISDLVFKTARHTQKGLRASKFAPKWE